MTKSELQQKLYDIYTPQINVLRTALNNASTSLNVKEREYNRLLEKVEKYFDAKDRVDNAQTKVAELQGDINVIEGL